MKKHLLTTAIGFMLMVSSNLFSQSPEVLYSSVFKKTTSENETMFTKLGWKMDSYKHYQGETIITFDRTQLSENIFSSVQCVVCYKDGNPFPYTVNYISINDPYIYNALLQNCKDKAMKRYYNEEDNSSDFDVAYSGTDYAFGFTTIYKEPMISYVVAIMK